MTFELVILNPNTSSDATQTLHQHARRIARPGTNVVTLCPNYGPEAVEHWGDAYRSAVAMLDRIESYRGTIDALVMAGFGEVGLEALREAVNAPVVDITQAGAAGALTLGGNYGIITTVASMIAPIRSSLSDSGLLERCTRIEPLGLGIAAAGDPNITVPRLIEVANVLVDRGAEVVCLGSAAFSPYADIVRDAVGTPIVDPLYMAIQMIESSCVRNESTAAALLTNM